LVGIFDLQNTSAKHLSRNQLERGMYPKVVINCAMSVDGKIALPTRKQTQISNEEDLKRVFNLRNECDAILVGIGTVLADDPKLNVKEEYVDTPNIPLRIVLDSKGRTPHGALVLNDMAPTLIVTSEECQIEFKGVDVLRCGKGRIDLKRLMEILYERGIETILVEGGETIIWSFIKEGLFDELTIFVGSIVIGGVTSPTPAGGKGASSEEEMFGLELLNTEKIGDGVVLHYKPKRKDTA
jgi:2,5-diamino-6-(ribosylamino)-4(3H)-pyrimidinone 5'-phosphate reductase